MKVSSTDGKLFVLDAETKADQTLIDALHSCSAAYVVGIKTGPTTPEGGREVIGVTLNADRAGEQALRDQAGRQTLSALGQLLGLGLSESAKHRHVSAASADPQAQEQLATRLVELHVVGQTSGDVVGQREIKVKEVERAHLGSVADTGSTP